MLFKNWNKIYTIFILLLILFLLNINPIYKKYILFNYDIKLSNSFIPIDPIMKNIYVPPESNSHHGFFQNNWNYLSNDNNIPGILPGPRPGNTLGLNNIPSLSLLTPIKAPLVDNIFINKCKNFSPYNGSYCQCTNNYLPI